MSSALVIGCGYVGEGLLRALSDQGWQAIGLTLSEGSAVKLRSHGLKVVAADIRDSNFVETLETKSFSLVIHCASSGRGGSNSYEAVFAKGTKNLFAALQFSHFLFVSSTSVYGQTDGSTVDELSPAEPERPTGKILLETETLVLNRGGTVARLAGIYGPGRCVPLQRLLSGDAVIEGKGERIMNSIYRDDAVDALLCLATSRPGGIFNVVDDCPASQLEWFRWVCQRVGKPLPTFGPRDLARKRAWTNKKVSNAKLRRLGWQPRFPSFREGIERILSAGGTG
ncbi:MAG TPA: NAD-dependent epimerase/dehydratase family protein [Chthoniobacterales bacterium]|nr:NAD-dependent epimerase/dehydratase family protein [Chthoniobacterales bacterium]